MDFRTLLQPAPTPRRCRNGAWSVNGRRYRTLYLARRASMNPWEFMMWCHQRFVRRMSWHFKQAMESLKTKLDENNVEVLRTQRYLKYRRVHAFGTKS